MLVEEIMPKARERLASIGADAPLREAADLMSKPHTDLVVACDAAGVMVGILTKTDIVRYIRQCCDGGMAPVEVIMTRDVVSSTTKDVLRDVWNVMNKRGLQRIPVIDDNRKPIGIVYARDALQSLLGEANDEDELLREYIGNTGYR